MKKEDLEVRGFEVLEVGYPEGVMEGQVSEGVMEGDPEGGEVFEDLVFEGGEEEVGSSQETVGGVESNPVLDEIARRGEKGKPVSVLELIDARLGHRDPGSVSVLDVIRERRFGMK